MAGKFPPAEERLWNRVQVTPGCWLWLGGRNGGGYGSIMVNGKTTSTHRFAYTLMVGPIPDGVDLDHTCHNNDTDCPGGPCKHRTCVNPDHLDPVWPGENLRRSHLTVNGLNSRRELCPQGHDYTWTVRENGKAYRWCRPCKQERERVNAAAINAAKRAKYLAARTAGLSSADAKAAASRSSTAA